MLFVRYDPVFRNLVASESSARPDELRLILSQLGVSFIEIDELPGPFETLYVNQNFQVMEAVTLPEGCLPESTLSPVETTVPALDLPAGGVTDPPAGTVLRRGDHAVTVRAPGYIPHHFTITVYTAENRRDDLIGYARNHRWQMEQFGAPFEGFRLDTSDRCKTLIASCMAVADILAKRGQPWQTNWSFLDGKRVVGRADLDEMALAIGVYVGTLFATCDAVEAEILDDRVTTEEDVEGRFSAAVPQVPPAT